jgi:hypothetical protein
VPAQGPYNERTYRIRHSFDDLRPRLAHVHVNLGQVVERTKGHKAVLQTGQWWHIATLGGWSVAQEALGESHELFSEFLARILRVYERVRQSIINASHARGVGIANVPARVTRVSACHKVSQARRYSRDLHGRRFECHDVESVARSVASEFNQQVNAVLSYHVSDTARIESVD